MKNRVFISIIVLILHIVILFPLVKYYSNNKTNIAEKNNVKIESLDETDNTIPANNYSDNSSASIGGLQKFKEDLVIDEQVVGKVLIYHTHTSEGYYDYDVAQAGDDLAIKLREYGLEVDHILEIFDVADYNKAYYSVRDYLNANIDFSQYDLIIDMHRDSGPNQNTVMINEEESARPMLVYSYDSGNYETISNIGNILKSHNPDFFRADTCRNRGVIYYNQDLSDNILLLEFGNELNTKNQIKVLNKYMAIYIADTIKNIKTE